MTQSEFIKQYCKNSNISEEELKKQGQFPVLCNCDDFSCKGWQMLSLRSKPYDYPRT